MRATRSFLKEFMLTGKPITATDTLEITDTDLRDLILRRFPATSPRRAPATFFNGPLEIDGGKSMNIRLIMDPRTPSLMRSSPFAPCGDGDVLNLTKLTTDNEGSSPPLVLRNCRIEGILDLSDSYFSSLEIQGCQLRGLRGVGLRIASQCLIRDVRPLRTSGPTLDGCADAYCQLHLTGAVIGGALDIQAALLRSPPVRLSECEPLPAGQYADQFALALSMSTIEGRLILSDVEAWGGVSLYQARVAGSLSIHGGRIAAHEAHEPPTRIPNSTKSRARRNYVALDAAELRVGGTFRWVARHNDTNSRPWNIYGRALLMRSDITGDMMFRGCRWQPGDGPGSRGMIECGGIDARYTRIGGQFRIDGDSVVARRFRVPSGLRAFNGLGPAVDLWKSSIQLGVKVDRGTVLHGALRLNESIVGRQIFIACRFPIRTGIGPVNSPYHLALDLTDTTLTGHLKLGIPHIRGRVTLERMSVIGSIEIRSLCFDHTGVEPAIYRPAKLPVGATVANMTAGQAKRFDETSLLDMQDLTVSGGVNIKRGAISIRFSREGSKVDCLPPNGFIVDQRGMKVESWDDADATCWRGLYAKPNPRGVPWRLRMDGIVLGRLDSSVQQKLVNTAASTVFSWKLPFHSLTRLIGNAIARKDVDRILLGYDELRDMRLTALASFHVNRPRPKRSWRRQGFEFFYRWTFQPSWQRRRSIPATTVQPYEAFARAYLQRGELDIALSLTKEKLERLWHRRARIISQVGAVPTLLAIGVLLTVGVTWCTPLDPVARHLLLLIALALASPVILIMLIGMFRFLFGYGVNYLRTSLTVTGFVLASAFFTPLWADDSLWKTLTSHDAGSVARSLNYGIDKFVPVIDLHGQLYEVKNDNALASIRKGNAESALIVAPPGRDDGSMVAFPRPADKPDSYIFVDHILDMLGWIVFSLALLTFSGLLRRDLDR